MGIKNRRVDLYRGVKAPARDVVANRWDRRPFEAVARLSRSYLRVWGNNDNNLTRNGERRVLERLRFDSAPVVFDVGANRGDWTHEVLRHHPDAIVQCFEPTPTTAERLSDRFRETPGVSVHSVALSSRSGTGALHLDDAHHSMNSLTARPHVDEVETAEVTLRRGDEVMADLDLERIDFLKVDTEGHDLSVIQGFEGALHRGAVAAIQFEYNLFSIFSRTLLLDYYEYLAPLGYTIGKIRPNGVHFVDYDVAEENWIGPDCVAVHRSRPDLSRSLATRS